MTDALEAAARAMYEAHYDQLGRVPSKWSRATPTERRSWLKTTRAGLAVYLSAETLLTDEVVEVVAQVMYDAADSPSFVKAFKPAARAALTAALARLKGEA